MRTGWYEKEGGEKRKSPEMIYQVDITLKGFCYRGKKDFYSQSSRVCDPGLLLTRWLQEYEVG